MVILSIILFSLCLSYDGPDDGAGDPSATKHYPALGEATISGLMVIADNKTGLANKVEPIILGKCLENRI